MNYLLVNHIAAHAGEDAAHLRLPRAWARDLSAATRAARDAGAKLMVATPLSSEAPPADFMDVVPDERGFEHIPLPHYTSAQTFLRERSELRARLEAAIAVADVVQLDLGGHPMPLGLFTDPLSRAAGKPTLWMLSGDRMPNLHPGGESRSATKRMVGRTLGTRVRGALADALRGAAAIVTTSESIGRELSDRFGVGSSLIETLDVRDDAIASDAEIGLRHRRLLEPDRPLHLVMPGEQTVDRNAGHVLAAMHRCWRLRAPVTLTASSLGTEADAIRRQAEDLRLSGALTLVETPTLETADVVVDPSLTNASRHDLQTIIGRGVPTIAYAPRCTSPGVIEITRGAVDALADAIFLAATDRETLASEMIRGHAWVRERTVDAAHRQRFAIAARLATQVARGAA